MFDDPYQTGEQVANIMLIACPVILVLAGAAVAAWAIAHARQQAPKKPASWERDPPYPDT
jgi:flagellar basal body-associated protein FliL